MNKQRKGGGIVGGFLLFIIGISLLWWNEGRTAKTISLLKEAKANYVQLDTPKIDKANNNKLVSTNGKLDVSSSKELVDEEFGVKASSAKMERIVEVYQWDEECTTDEDNNTTCTYKKEWSSDLIDSSTFKEKGHDNPTSKQYENKVYLGDNVKLGEFVIPNDLVSKLSTKESIRDLNSEVATSKNLKISSNGDSYTNTQDEANPQIGDMKITFNKNNTTDVSILAVQTNDTFSAYTAKNGKSLEVIREANMTGAEIIAALVKNNNMLKWIFRLIGFILVSCGIASLFSFLTMITSRIPILGSLVGGTISLISMLLGLAISFIVCAIAWFRFRPIISIILLVGAGVAICLVKFLPKKKEN